MKKLLGIVVLGLLLYNVSFAKIIRLEKCYNSRRDSFDNKRYENKYWDIDLEKKKIKRVTIKTDSFLKEEREANEQVKEEIPGYEGRTFNKIINSESNILFVDSNFIKAQQIHSRELIKTTWDFTIDLSKNTVDMSMETLGKETLKKHTIYAKYKCYRK